MSKDRLLSDEELDKAILEIPEVWAEDSFNAIRTLINTQKRLYAESVIGEDEPYAREAGVDERYANHWNDNTFNRNELRAEQRARIK